MFLPCAVTQVHVRTKPCYGRTDVSCNCAVAVREGNHVLGVYACDPDKPPVAIRYLVDPLVPGADIEISPSGRKYTVKKEFGKTLECRAQMLYSESIIILFMFELYLRLCANSKCFVEKNKERGSGEGAEVANGVVSLRWKGTGAFRGRQEMEHRKRRWKRVCKE